MYDEEKFKHYLKLQKEHYLKEYYFLGISEEKWNHLFSLAVKNINEKQPRGLQVKNYVNQHISDYIKREIMSKKTRIIRNLLVLIKNNSKTDKEVLQKFLHELKYLHIEIDEEYYELLCQESLVLQTVLINLDLFHVPFSQLEKEFELTLIYLKIIPGGISFLESKKIFEYLMGLLDDQEREDVLKVLQNNSFNSVNCMKFKYFIRNYDIFESVYRIFIEQIRYVSEDSFMLMLLYFSLEELKRVVEGYYRFIGMDHDMKRKPAFLYQLDSRLEMNKDLMEGKKRSLKK